MCNEMNVGPYACYLTVSNSFDVVLNTEILCYVKRLNLVNYLLYSNYIFLDMLLHLVLN